MKSARVHGSLLLSAFCAAFALSSSLFPAGAMDSAAVKKLFLKPTREFSTAPLWVWNDQLTEQQITDTMRDLAGQHVKQVFVHPRPGLMTPYLSADWFRLWRVALKEAERLDMNVWIYDENSYPSGFAGGWVPELMPESRGRGLALREAKAAPKWTDDLIRVHRLNGDQIEDVTAAVKAGETLAEGRYVVASLLRAGNSPWHGGRCYVDLLYPGVTEKFLEVTLDAYKREIGGQFGKRIPGAFTDEPNIHPAGGLPWTDGLPAEFQKRWGYSLLERLPSLNYAVGDWRKVRHDYFQVLLDQFIAHWAKPYSEYCSRNNLEWTGHYWEHDWPRCLGVPDNMAMYAWHQRPAIDILMNQYAESTHAQFGNVRAAKELSSVANQLAKKRTLVELYGAGGWDLRFEDMKRIGDWLQVLGVNTLDEHLSYITIRGARKRDHPQSFSYHEPWWEAYHENASYLTRLSVAMSQGAQVNPILVLEPTSTAWMYDNEAQNHPRLGEVGDAFQNLLLDLERAQVEYDIGCEDIMASHGSVSGASLRVGQRAYAALVIPPFTENLNLQTLRLIEDLLRGGGIVICCGDVPARVDGAVSERGAALAKSPGWRTTEAGALPAVLRPFQEKTGFSLQRKDGDKGILFHHRRTLEDGQLLLLVNTSITDRSAGEFETSAHGVEQWDLRTGKGGIWPFEASGSGVRAAFDLPPSGSLLLFLANKPGKPSRAVPEIATVIPPSGPTEVQPEQPNVLTLDYVDITAGGETLKDSYFYQASQFAFQRNGMERNPWDSAVQFRDELITKTFPAASGFEAAYHFVVESGVPPGLSIVIESAELYTITCNGKPLVPAKGQWWLDRAFARIDLSSVARVGENTITLKAAPFTIRHELEPAYLLGAFTLKPSQKGFVVAPGAALKLGPWNEQGYPFYSAGAAYRQEFDVSQPSGRHAVALASWYGSVAKVLVNGKPAGFITAPPWKCNVSGKLQRGKNTITVVVVGTLKNTLGPHHGKPGLGSAWPGMFHNGPKAGPPPGADYSTVGYGLFAPFQLERIGG